MTNRYCESGTNTDDCEIDSAVYRVSNSINKVTQKAGKIANGTIRTAIIARDGMDKVNQSIVGLRKIAVVMSDLAAMIEQLSLHSALLRDIPDAFQNFTAEVSDVTSKHLNQSAVQLPDAASIREMKEELEQIALRTVGSVNEVSQQITRLSSEIDTCVNAIDGGIKQVEESHRAAYNSFTVLDRVFDTLEDNSVKIDQVLSAAEEVSVSGNEMIDIVNRVVAEINSSAQYITHISGKLRNGTLPSANENKSSNNGKDMTLYSLVRDDLLLA